MWKRIAISFIQFENFQESNKYPIRRRWAVEELEWDPVECSFTFVTELVNQQFYIDIIEMWLGMLPLPNLAYETKQKPEII